MKTPYLLFLILFCFSCSDKKTENENREEAQSIVPDIDVQEQLEVKPLQKDSIILDFKGNEKRADKVVVNLLEKTYSKDSLGESSYRIDFYKQNKIISSFPIKISFGMEEGIWYVNEEFMEEEDSDTSVDKKFVQCVYGIEACGYTQTNFLFYLNEDKVQLVDQWLSASDSGYGTQVEFVPKIKENKTISFISRRIQIESEEEQVYDDSAEKIKVSYSDSIQYQYKNNKWEKLLVTPEEKIYRVENTTFQDYYE